MVSEFVSLVSLHVFQRKPLSLTKLIQQQASYSSLSFLHIHCITILSDNECLSHVCPSACIGSSSIVPFMCASFRECNSWASSVPPILSSNSKPVSTLISPSRPTSNSHRSYQPLPQGGLYSYTVEAWRSSDTEQFVPTPKRATSQNWARFCHLPRTVPTQFPVLVELKLIQ